MFYFELRQTRPEGVLRNCEPRRSWCVPSGGLPISRIGGKVPIKMRSRCLSQSVSPSCRHSGSVPLFVQSNLHSPPPRGWGRNMSTMGRAAVLETNHMTKEPFFWEAPSLGTELGAHGARPRAPNFLTEKGKQEDLIKTSWSDDSRWQVGFLQVDFSGFEFTIWFPVLIQGVTFDFCQEEES